MMIPDEIILAAIEGDPIAQSCILEYYDRYINSITVTAAGRAARGKTRLVDEDVKIQVQLKLLESIKKFV